MSKFIDKLNRILRGEPQPMGFRKQESASTRPKIQLVASLTRESTESLDFDIKEADAGLLRIFTTGTGVESLQKISKAFPDIPWGGWLKGGDGNGFEQLTKAGCDFIVFPASDTPLATIENTGAGRIIGIEPSISDGLLRAINEMPVDAVLISGEQNQALTWQHLMLFKRFAALLTKPLLVSIPAAVTGSELKALWEAGVTGVLVEVSPEQPQDSLKKLRQVIDKLEFPPASQREKAEPLLSRTGREREPGKTAIEIEVEEE